jgi:endonuclease/exonuclease/phosphatase family metal-dependent hydrolase
MRGSRLLRLLLLSVNAFSIASLLLSVLASYIDPNTFLLPAFFGLAFLPIFIVNLLFAIFWLIIRPKYVLFGAIGMLLSIPMLANHVSLFSKDSDEGGVKVLSYNVRLFDLYNWTNNESTRDDLLDYFKETDADIICLQEYFRSDDKAYFNTLDTLLQVQDANEVHEHFTAVMHHGNSRFGIATLSKYPIVHRGHVPLDTAGNNVAIYTDLKIGADTVRVFNLHLASVHISALESGITEHIERNDQQKQWDDLKLLVRKLAGGYKIRANQVEVIESYIELSPHPVILCGDLNDTPASYSYASLESNLSDAFKGSGSKFGTSYIGYYPSLRIDYMMHSPSIIRHSFETQDVHLSDHRPILGSFSIE